MRICIISDIHGNYDALSTLPAEYDELWVLGDLVNYGPQPAEVVDFVSRKASIVVRGNHDHCIAYNADPRCSPRFLAISTATRKFTSDVLSESQKQFLGALPLHAEVKRGNTSFCLVHSVPSNTLYGHYGEDSERWPVEVDSTNVDVLFVGHTHKPFVKMVGGRTVCNPGSLGQPLHGKPEARYAIWEDGSIELKGFDYPVEETIRKVMAMPVENKILLMLAKVLRKGK
jgi:putative phosphoesterase